MRAASSALSGLPSMWPPMATMVSAPTTGSDSEGATVMALARARRMAASGGVSPGRSVSSAWDTTTRNGIPRACRMAARRGEAEASTSEDGGAEVVTSGTPEDGYHAGHQRGGAFRTLEHVLVGAVRGARLFLIRDGRARVQDDGDVDPLHRGLDHVDDVPAPHRSAHLELERDHVRLLVGDGGQSGVAAVDGARRHVGSFERGLPGGARRGIVVDEQHRLLPAGTGERARPPPPAARPAPKTRGS